MHVQIARRMHLWSARFQRRERVRHGFIDFVFDPHFIRRRARVKSRIGHHQNKNIADATSGFAHRNKDRQVGNSEASAALSGHVRRAQNPDDTRHRQRFVGMNRQHLGARMLAQYRSSMEHSRHAHVIDERPVPHRLFDAVIARRRLPNAILFGRRTASPPVLLAKIKVPARLFRDQALPLVPVHFAPGLASSLHRVQNARVASAAAQMSVERLGHRVAIRCASILDQRRRAHHDARDTEAALHRAFVHKRLAQ